MQTVHHNIFILLFAYIHLLPSLVSIPLWLIRFLILLVSLVISSLKKKKITSEFYSAAYRRMGEELFTEAPY